MSTLIILIFNKRRDTNMVKTKEENQCINRNILTPKWLIFQSFI